MSYTEVYAITKAGRVRPFGEASNAFHGAIHVWAKVAGRVGIIRAEDEFGRLMADGEQVLWPIWRATTDERLMPWERIVLAASLDNCVVLGDGVTKLAGAMEEWCQEYGIHNNNLLVQAQLLKKIARLKGRYQGACFNQTSVNSDAWRVGSRWYDLRVDTGHWELFDHYPELA